MRGHEESLAKNLRCTRLGVYRKERARTRTQAPVSCSSQLPQGRVSRRWQIALAAPSLPVWLALLVMVVALTLLTSSSVLSLYPSSGSLADLYPGALVLMVAGPLLSILLVVTALGGLGWLARRAFAR
jgi:hypothetical protein